jgi:uncharacterized protein YegP (UPF0339 family)
MTFSSSLETKEEKPKIKIDFSTAARFHIYIKKHNHNIVLPTTLYTKPSSVT